MKELIKSMRCSAAPAGYYACDKSCKHFTMGPQELIDKYSDKDCAIFKAELFDGCDVDKISLEAMTRCQNNYHGGDC